MMKIEVKGLAGITANLKRLANKNERDKALAMAVNKTVAKAKTAMTRQITQTYRIKRSEVIKRLAIRKASAKAGSLMIEARLSASRPMKGRGI